MQRLVLLLAVLLAGVAVNRFAKARPRVGINRPEDAFPFPTRESHASISLDGDGESRRWAEELGCTETELRDAVSLVGSSAERVREHLGKTAATAGA